MKTKTTLVYDMYKVFYMKNSELKEAFFEDKETAEQFKEMVNGVLNRYLWKVEVEK